MSKIKNFKNLKRQPKNADIKNRKMENAIVIQKLRTNQRTRTNQEQPRLREQHRLKYKLN